MRQIRSGRTWYSLFPTVAIVIVAGLIAGYILEDGSPNSATSLTQAVGSSPSNKPIDSVQTRQFFAYSDASQKRVSWNLNEAPLSQVLALLATEAGCPVYVNWAALDEEGVNLETTITIHLRDVALRSALNIVLERYHSIALWNDQGIHITSQLDAANYLEIRTYLVRDLLPGSGHELERYAEQLQEIVQWAAEPNSWLSVGGTGEIAIDTERGIMIVAQTAALHHEIEQIVHMLRSGENRPASEMESRILRALEQRVSFSFNREPLQSALDCLGDLAAIGKIVIDRYALEEEGVPFESPVTADANNRPMKLALRQLLNQYNLNYVVSNDVLVVTSQLRSGNELEMRVIGVADLLGNPPDPDTLIQIIENCVAPNSWDSVGGAGTIQLFDPRSLLIVRQTQSVHEQITQLLTALRTGTQPFESDDDLRLQVALARPIQFDFQKKRLGDAIRWLASQAAILNVSIDRERLADEGVTTDDLVTLRGSHISIGAAMHCLLRQFRLDFALRAGSLWITSGLELGNELCHRTYPVADLLSNLSYADELIDLIERTTSPSSWSRLGGAAEIQYFQLKQCLIVNATEEGHQEVAALLRQLRGLPDPTAAVEDQIRQSLRCIHDWTFVNGTLEELADRLALGLDCTVITDQAAIQHARIDGSLLISVNARNEPLDAVLTRALADHGLMFAIDNGKMRITDKSGESLPLHARTYVVSDLLRTADAGDRLAMFIESRVAPDWWSNTGGTGAACYYHGTGHLVVYQDLLRQREVEAFVNQLRHVRASQ